MAVRWLSNCVDRMNMTIEIIGLADQQYNVRLSKRNKLKRKTARGNVDELESKVWERTLGRLPTPPINKNIRWVRVCDRGADIYEVLIQCLQNNYGFVIRSAYDRMIDTGTAEKVNLFQYARSVPKLGSFSLFPRSRSNEPERIAKLSMAAQLVKIRSPQRPGYKSGDLPSVECTVIRVWEPNPPEGIEPLEWILLSDQHVHKFEEVMICINQYACRWLIEDFHKALKTGLGVEKLQLEEANRLFAAIAIMSIVALRLVEIRERFRIAPDDSAENAGLSSLELEVLEIRLKRQLKTVKDVSLAIGRLGGHMNRKRDGMPGLITLWRGVKRLLELTEGIRLSKNLMEKFG